MVSRRSSRNGGRSIRPADPAGTPAPVARGADVAGRVQTRGRLPDNHRQRNGRHETGPAADRRACNDRGRAQAPAAGPGERGRHRGQSRRRGWMPLHLAGSSQAGVGLQLLTDESRLLGTALQGRMEASSSSMTIPDSVLASFSLCAARLQNVQFWGDFFVLPCSDLEMHAISPGVAAGGAKRSGCSGSESPRLSKSDIPRREHPSKLRSTKMRMLVRRLKVARLTARGLSLRQVAREQELRKHEWCEWCAEHGYQSMPADPAPVAGYLTERALQGAAAWSYRSDGGLDARPRLGPRARHAR